MPVYKVGADIYDIPEDKITEFEAQYPDATQEYRVGDDVYDIPLDIRKEFETQYLSSSKEGQPIDKSQHTLTAEQLGLEDNAYEAMKGLAASPQMPVGSATLPTENRTREELLAERKRLEDAKREAELRLRTRRGEIASPSGMYQMGMAPVTGNQAAEITDPEMTKLYAAVNSYDNAIRSVDRKLSGEEPGFWEGVADATVRNPGFYTMGLTDMSEARGMLNIAQDGIEEREDELFADALYSKNAEQQDEDFGFLYRAGNMFGHSVPFMVQTAVTGGFSGASRAGANLAGRLGKKAAEGTIKKKVINAMGTTIDDVIEAGLIANTAGAGGTWANIAERKAGKINIKDGDYVFENGESWLGALYKGEVSSILELYTEKLGGHLEGKLSLTKGLDKIGASRVSNVLLAAKNSDLYKGASTVMRQFGLNGYLPEVLEEEANLVLNSLLVGDNSLSELYNPRTQLDILGGMLLTVGTMQAIPGTIATAGYVKNQYQLNRADRRAADVFGEEWTTMKEALDNATNEDVAGVVSENLRDNGTQDMALLNYYKRMMIMRGYNIGTVKNETAPEVEEAYTDGFSQEPTGANALNAMTGYDIARLEVARAIGLAEGDDVDVFLNGRTAEDVAKGDTDVENAVKNYQLQKARMEGIQEKFQQTREQQYEESDRSIDSNANKANPDMTYSTTYKGEEVFIRNGNVVLNEDGTIDVNNSSESLYVKFPDGHVEMIAPENFSEVFTEDRTEDLKAAKRAEIDERWKAEFDAAEAQAIEQEKREAGIQTENAVADDATDNGTPTESEANVAPTGDNVTPVAPVENNEPAPVELPDVPDFFRLGGKNYSVASRNDDGSVDVMVDGKRETLPAGTDYSTHMPTDKKGEVQYEQMPVERTHEYFVQKVKDDEARAEMIEKRRKKAEAERKKFDKKPDPGIDPDAYEAKMTQWEADKKDAQAKVDYWKEVAKRDAEITRSETREAVNNIKPDVVEETADEFIANQLAGIKITPESFKRETGLSNAEQAQLVGVISNDGVSVERAAEIITENYDSELKALGFTGDVQDVRDAIISILSQGNPRGYAKRGYEARVQDDVDQQRADAEAWAKGAFDMKLEELYLYEETILPRIMRDYEGFDENEYYSNLAENNGYDTTRESESIGRGGELLQGEQPVPAGGTPVAGQRNEGGAVSDDVQGGGQNGVAQEEVPVNEPVGNSEQLSSSEFPNNQSVAGLEGYSTSEILDLVKGHIFEALGEDVRIVDMRIIGSRTNRTNNADSDLDVLVEYEGEISEDSFFNAVNDEEGALYIDGIRVDINPITKDKSGSIEQWMNRNKGYSKAEGNAPGNDALSPAFATQERKGGTITLHTKTETKKGYKTTRVVAMRNGSEVSMPRATFPVPEGMTLTDIPKGVKVEGVKELREGNDGRTTATIMVKYGDGSLGTMETRVVKPAGEPTLSQTSDQVGDQVAEGDAPGQSGVQEITNGEIAENGGETSEVQRGKSKEESESAPEIQEPVSVEDIRPNGDKRITNYNSRGEVATVAIERAGKVVSVDSYDEGVLFEHTEYDTNGKATSVTRYDKSGNVVGTQVYEDGKAVPSETTEQPETGEVADAGPVNRETLQLNMSEEDFNALLSSGDKAAISEYLAEVDGILRIGVGSPLDGRDAIAMEYRGLVDQYGGEENIPADVVAGIEERIAPYNALQRAVFDRKYALQDKLREIEASEAQAKEQAEKEAKAEHKQTAFNGFLAGKSDVGASTAEKALGKRYKFDDGVHTVAEYIEQQLENGTLKIETREEPKYKGVSRQAWNRMDARQQAAEEKRVKEGGMKTVYSVNSMDLGKTAYDYAKFLLDKKAEQEKAAAKQKVKDAIEQFAKKKAAEQAPIKIEDVGEKIGGARKDIIRQYADKIKLDGKTFSTMFPKPDIDKLIEAGLPVDKVAAVKAMYDNAKREFEIAKKRRGKDKALQASLFYAMYAKNVLTGEEGNFDLAYNGYVFTEWGKEFMKANIALYKAVFNKLGTDYGKVDLRSYFITPLAAGMRENFNLKKLNEENSRMQQRMAEMQGKEAPEYKDGDVINFVGEHYSRPSDQFETLEEAVNTMVERISKEVKVDETARYKVESYWKRDAQGRADYTKAYLGIKVRGFGTVDVMEFKNMNEARAWLQDHREDFQQMAAAKEEQVRAEKKKPLPKYVIGHSYNEAQSQYSVFADFGKEGVRILKTFDIPQAEGVAVQAKVRSEVYKNEVLPYINSEEAVQSADGIAQEIRDAKNAKPKSITIEKKSRERVGVDWRNGKDATPEMFVDVEGKEPSVFGFRAIEFGNYVSQKERQQFLNDIYDALMDMSEILGVSPRAFSLGGKLALAVGARGTSGASGHYEPYKNVINITKTRGAGVLAHEWLHALDRYFSNFDENAVYPNGVMYATQGMFADNTRKEVKEAFDKAMAAIKGGDYEKRSMRLGEYWASDKELAARALQDYIIRKLDDRGQKNDFLSNHVAPEEWDGDAKDYPFPLGEDAKRIADAFDNLFATLQEKTTEDGNVVLYSIAEDAILQDRGTEAFERATKVTMEAVERLKANGLDIEVASEEDVPQNAEKQTSWEIEDKYPNWLEGTTTDSGKHSTQVEGTRKTYKKVGDWIEENMGKDVAILDASSGMGYGTADLRERGFNIEDVEPYQSEKRKQSNPATYSSYGDIDKQYDYIISNAVLNVIPDDWRAGVLHDMADKLKTGGKIFINTRKAGEERSIKDKIELDSPQEVLVKRNGKIASYQRFFTPTELKEWVENELGEGYSVEIANKINSGTDGLAAVVVTKNNESPANGKTSESGQPISNHKGMANASLTNVSAKVGKNAERANRLDAIISSIEEFGEMGPHEFLHEVVNAMLLSTDVSTTDSRYAKLGGGVTLRLADHYGNASNYKGRKDAITNYGLVVKLSTKAFVPDNKVDYLEYVYFPDKLTKERQIEIAKGLKAFMETGRYELLPKPDKVHPSGKFVGSTELNTSDGKVYGWAVDGKIRLTPDGINPNTPVHEYAHLWGADVEKNNPKLWNEVVEAMKLSPVWNEVANDANYSNIHGNDSRMASEALARLSGRENYRRTMEEAQREIEQAKTIEEKAEKISRWAKVKAALKNFWNWVQRNVFRKKENATAKATTEVMPWEEFANSVVGDFYKGKNPNVKESPLEKMFIGEKGAANLDKAEEATTRLDNLAVAREMETAGKEAKAIKLATGWERGADGKWRYETEDVKLNRAAELFSLENYQSYPIAKSLDKGRVDFNGTIKLADLVNDEELFKAYPGMEEYYVSFEEMSANVKGEHDAANTMIRINKDDISELESTLVHEIQHAIQSIEGFARGGNSSTVAPKVQTFRIEVAPLHNMMLDTPEWAEKKRLQSRWLDEWEKPVPDESYMAQLQERVDEIDNSGVLKEIEAKQNELIKKYGYNKSVLDIISGPYSDDADIWNRLPESFYDKIDAYRRLAGEVESRNVQERMNMSPEERSESLAEETADVARKDQIFIYDALESAMMGSRVDARMAEVAAHFEGKQLTAEQQAVADVFGGKADNLTISVKTKEGNERRVVMRQGNEMGAGAKHSLYRHFGTGVGVITSDDIISIPDVIANGVRTEKQRGSTRLAEYKLTDRNGDEFTVLTEIKKGKEIFNDFYSNKKAPLSGTFNTQSAHTANNNALSADKGSDNSSNTQEGETRSRTVEEVVEQQEENEINLAKETVTSLGENLNSPVKIMDNIDSVPENRRKWKGWFDPETGEVVVVMPNHVSTEDAVQTVLHEVVGHRGLRAVLGEDFDGFLDGVYKNASQKVKRGINDKFLNALKNGPALTVREATEEYIAELAERDFEGYRDTWNAIKQWFRNFFRNFMNMEITDGELRYLLWKNYNRMKSGPIETILDRAMEANTGTGNVMPRTAETFSAVNAYNKSVKGLKNKFKEGWYDEMRSVRKAQEAIEKELGRELLDSENVYLYANHIPSINKNKKEVFDNKYLRPFTSLLKRLYKVKVNGKELDEKAIERYANAKHGIERNREMSVKNALTEAKDGQRVFNEEAYKSWAQERDEVIERNLPWAEEQRELDKVAEKYGAKIRDYSGLTAIFDTEKKLRYKKIADAAYQYVEDVENALGDDVKELWGLLKGMTDYSLNEAFESGLMSKSTYEHIKQMYRYYVPLRGFTEETAEDFFDYVEGDHSPLNAVVKTAYGRTSEADNIFATILNMANSAIVQGSKNRLKQRLLNLAMRSQTGLLSVDNAWYEKKGDTYEPVKYPENANEYADFEERMKDKEKRGEVVRHRPGLDIGWKVAETWNKTQHAVRVKRNGREYVVWVNGDPAMANAINGLLREEIGGAIKTVNQFRSKMVTQYSPTFVFTNLLRDVQSASIIYAVRRGTTMLKEFEKNVASNATDMMDLYLKHKRGTLDVNNPKERYFKEFLENGGETGYTEMISIEEYEKKLKELTTGLNIKNGTQRAFEAVGGAVDFANRCVENLCRFSAYQTSREAGISILKSIEDAKEVSVNFNRKGSGAMGQKWAKALYMFLNPAVQSIAQRILLTKKYPKKMTAVWAGEFILGAAMPVLYSIISAAFGDDDDEITGNYYNLSDYRRRSSLCLPLKDGVFHIPLSHESRVLFGLGELCTSVVMGHEKPEDAPIEALNTLAQSLPLNPVEGWMPGKNIIETMTYNFMPDAVKPIAEAAMNRDFAGNTVHNRTDFNEFMPEYMRGKRGTLGVYKKISKYLTSTDGYEKSFLNDTFGALLNPSVMEHLLEGYLGGLYTFGEKVAKASAWAFGDEEYAEFRNIPIASSFYTSLAKYEDKPTESRTRRDWENAFRFYKDEVKGYDDKEKTAKNGLKHGEEGADLVLEQMERNGEVLMVDIFNDGNDRLKELYGASDAAKKNRDFKRVEDIDQQIYAEKRNIVSQMEQLADDPMIGYTFRRNKIGGPYGERETYGDVRDAKIINDIQKELKPLYEEYKDAYDWGDNTKEEDLWYELDDIERDISDAKSEMKDYPEDADELMAEIRELRAKAMELINNYRKDE